LGSYVCGRVKKDLVAASAEPLVLSLLSRGENYGYAIIQSLHAVSREKIEWTDGMLYPVLHRIERKGWIKSRWIEAESGRKRKYYRLTARGEKALAEQRSDWMAVNTTLVTLWKEHHV
jgi:PadR family transcriptional regulator PadR